MIILKKYLAEKDLDLTATLDAEAAYRDADFVIIATPTNYDSQKNFFDTSSVEAVIKSTIPVGYTKAIRERRVSSSVRSFSAKARLSMITCIPAASSWVRI